MFVVDLLLVGKATEEYIKYVIATLDNFGAVSCQVVSTKKTSNFFSKNVLRSTRAMIVCNSRFK